MHPKAAFLALHGFRCFGYKGGPCSARIKRGEGDDEDNLYLRDDGWVIARSFPLECYAEVGFGVYSAPEWKLLPQELMEEFCAS